MRLKEVRVTKLFGIFDHIVQLNLDERITIMHAPNGFGKTAILSLVNALSNEQYADLLSIPFETFTVIFDDPFCSIRVEVAEAERTAARVVRRSRREVVLHCSLSSGREETYRPITASDPRELDFPHGMIDDLIPDLRRMSANRWRSIRTGEHLSIREVIARYGDLMPPRFRSQVAEPEWLRALHENWSVRLIETQRLQIYRSTRQAPDYSDRGSIVYSVAEYSADLAKAIQATLAEYASRSQSLDRTFPKRVLSHRAPESMTVEDLRKSLDDLEARRSAFVEAGLINPEGELDFQIPASLAEGTLNLLDVYVNDANEKLNVLDNISLKVEVLKRSINTRFLFKSISVSRDKGFTITTSDGNSIEPTSLSSGEQHELVLIYELLFKAGKDSLILIDEPEISLHVDWQHEFLRDIKEIADLSMLDVVIATHSPQIIGSRWDLTVELKGPE